jgi:putative transcriptional regulator
MLDWRLYDDWKTIPRWPRWSNLRSVRFWSGLSQEELAAAVGVSRKTISSLECGRSTPSLALARALARELSVPLDELIDDDERP